MRYRSHSEQWKQDISTKKVDNNLSLFNKKVTTQRDADRRIGERLGDEVQINFVLQNCIILFVRPTGEERYSQSWRQCNAILISIEKVKKDSK